VAILQFPDADCLVTLKVLLTGQVLIGATMIRNLSPVFAGCLGVTLLVATLARAADPAIQAADTSVRLGVSAGYGTYAENVTPQDSESGALLGVSAAVSTLTPGPLVRFGMPDIYSNIQYDFSAGFLNYNGNLNDPGKTSYRTRDNAYYNNVVVRLGVGAPLSGTFEFIPYIAGGYQNWYRNIGGGHGYGEYYQAGLVGGGLRLDFAQGRAFVVSASAEGFAVIGGSVNVASQNFNGQFGTSAQERVSLDADYRLNSAWHAFAGLGLTHYTYTGSKAGTDGIYEPLSATLQVNSTFGIAYGF
jgi:hypothetical protein